MQEEEVIETEARLMGLTKQKNAMADYVLDTRPCVGEELESGGLLT